MVFFMNAKEVFAAVAALVSENRVENEPALYASLNRALQEIGLLSPRLTLVSLSHPASFGRKEAGGRIFYPAASLCPECAEEAVGGDSTGNTDGTGGTSSTSSTGCTGGRRVLFDSPLSVTRDGEPVDPDRLGLVGEEAGLSLPAVPRGRYHFLFPVLPGEVTPRNRDSAFPLRSFLLPLVPLLAAYYYAMEEESDKKEELLARYSQTLSELRRNIHPAEGGVVENMTGW